MTHEFETHTKKEAVVNNEVLAKVKKNIISTLHNFETDWRKPFCTGKIVKDPDEQKNLQNLDKLDKLRY